MATKNANGRTGASGRSSGGGGINTKQHVRVGVKAGPPQTKKISVSAASHIGRSVGNHASDSGGKTMQRPADPLIQAKVPQVPMGNAVALNVGRGSPGAGRVISPAGTQGCHSGTGAALGTKMRPQGGK
jgi:hypothetical protein